MTDDTQFKPFVPPQPMFEEGKDADPPAAGKPVKPKRNRKPRKPSSALGGQVRKPRIPPAPKHERPKRKKKRAATKTAHDKKLKNKVGKAFKTTRAAINTNLYGDKKKRKSRALKMSLTDAMAISALLKPKDFAMFDSLTETLQSVNKATRKRVLAAIRKVFG